MYKLFLKKYEVPTIPEGTKKTRLVYASFLRVDYLLNSWNQVITELQQWGVLALSMKVA